MERLRTHPSQESTNPRRKGRGLTVTTNVGLVAVTFGALAAGPAAAAFENGNAQGTIKPEAGNTLSVGRVNTGSVDLDAGKVVLRVAPVAAVEAAPAAPVRVNPPKVDKPGLDRHGTFKLDTLSGKVNNELEKQFGDKKISPELTNMLVAIDAQVSKIPDADKINISKKGSYNLLMTNPEFTQEIDDANDKKGDPQFVKYVAALKTAVTRHGYDSKAARAAAEVVIADSGVAIPKIDHSTTTTTVHKGTTHSEDMKKLTEGIKASAPMTDEQLIAADTATRANGWTKVTELNQPTIWEKQQHEGAKATNASLNLTSRMAVQLSKYDKDLNTKGTFDEHKMHTKDKFDEFGPEVKNFLDSFSDLTFMNMVELKGKLPPDTFAKVYSMWIIDNRKAPRTEKAKKQVEAQDRMALQTIVELAANFEPGQVKKNQAQSDFMAELNAAKTNAEKSAIVLKAYKMLPTFFFTTPPQDLGAGAGAGADADAGVPGNPLTQDKKPSTGPSTKPDVTPTPSRKDTSVLSGIHVDMGEVGKWTEIVGGAGLALGGLVVGERWRRRRKRRNEAVEKIRENALHVDETLLTDIQAGQVATKLRENPLSSNEVSRHRRNNIDAPVNEYGTLTKANILKIFDKLDLDPADPKYKDVLDRWDRIPAATFGEPTHDALILQSLKPRKIFRGKTDYKLDIKNRTIN